MYQSLCAAIQRDTYHKAPIVTLPFGVADCDKKTTIQVPGEAFARGSMALGENWARTQNAMHIDSYECHFTSIDLFLEQNKDIYPSFVKIDVEGAELYVLHGAAQLLASSARPLLFMEVFAPWEHAFGYGPYDVLELLMQYGYQFLFVCHEGLILHIPSYENPTPPQYVNGYNLIAFDPVVHEQRIKLIRPFFYGAGGRILPMVPPPIDNKLG